MMSSIGAILGRFGELYSIGNYAGALTLINDELPRRPHHQVILLCFSAAMSARLGDTPSALSTFQTALEAGYWYHEGALRNDPDFASLQGEPEFKTIVEQCASRRKIALSEAKPVLHVLDPVDTSQPTPLLIALHGNLSSSIDYAPYWKTAVDSGWRVALPQSKQLSWLSGFHDWPDDIEPALIDLEQHYHTLLKTYAIDAQCVVIAGFSRGALVAERATIQKRLPVRGMLLIDAIGDADFAKLLSDHQPLDFRAYLAASQSQDFPQTAQTFEQALQKHGIVSQVETLPGLYHEMPESFASVLEHALAFLCP